MTTTLPTSQESGFPFTFHYFAAFLKKFLLLEFHHQPQAASLEWIRASSSVTKLEDAE